MSEQTNTASLIVKYASFELDFAKLPQASVLSCLRGGVSHKFGSEVASKVGAYFKPDRKLAEGESRMEDTEENRQKLTDEYRQKLYDALIAGTVGVSTRGPTVDPIEVEINKIAKSEIKAILAENGVKFPKKSTDTVTIGGQALTVDQLISRRLDPTGPAGVDKKTGGSHVDRITKLAEKVMAEKAKAAKKAAETAKEAGGLDVL